MRTHSPHQVGYRHAFWVVLAVATLLRCFLIGRVEFGADEAHYVLYGRHPAWGYFDHPPMVGFLAALTAPLGDTLFAARVGPLVCWVAATLLVRRLVLAAYRDEAIAFWSMTLMLCVPLAHLQAVALLPDAPLNLFWCGALVGLWSATGDGRPWHWLVVGACFGGALLSKYHGVLLPLCGVCYLVIDREQRKWLRSPWPWVAFALGLVIFLPNVLWNWRHDWVSYAYQLGRGKGMSFGLDRLFENVVSQFAGASPILFVLLVVAWISLLRARPHARPELFLVSTSLPVFVFFWLFGLRSKLLPHWAFVGWWTGAVALVVAARRASAAGDPRGRRWRRWMQAGCFLGGATVVLVYAVILLPVAAPLYGASREVSLWLHERIPVIEPLERTTDVDPLYGYRVAAERVEEILETMPRPQETFVFSHRFFTTSRLASHLPPHVPATTLGRRYDQYRLWFEPSAHVGWDALYVDEQRFRHGPDDYGPLFTRIDDTPLTVQVRRGKQPARTLRVYRCYGYRGGYLPER